MYVNQDHQLTCIMVTYFYIHVNQDHQLTCILHLFLVSIYSPVSRPPSNSIFILQGFNYRLHRVELNGNFKELSPNLNAYSSQFASLPPLHLNFSFSSSLFSLPRFPPLHSVCPLLKPNFTSNVIYLQCLHD